MIVLLSPAKKLNETITFDKADISIPLFSKETNELAKKLKNMSAQKISDLMHLSSSLADLNYERYQNWKVDFTNDDQAKPASYLFDGEVYRGLEAKSVANSKKDYFQNHVFILSGLYGLLRPYDSILPYRLEMGTKWEINSKTKNLYAFWGDKIANSINSYAKESKCNYIINLASNEYFKAVPKKILQPDIITPVFKDFKNGDYKTIMVYAKKARGLMARFIVDHELREIENLKAFDSEGYYFSPKDSTSNQWTFLRD